MLVLFSRDHEAPVLLDVPCEAPLRIGRALSSDLVVKSSKVSGHHAEIRVRPGDDGKLEPVVVDISTNGTGFLDDPFGEQVTLVRNRAEVLQHGSQLLLPLRTAATGALADASEQTRITVHFPNLPDRPRPAPAPAAESFVSLGAGRDELRPDAYDEATGSGRWRYYEMLGEGGLGVVHRAYDTVGGLGNVAIKVSKWSSKSSRVGSLGEAWQVFILHREAQWSLKFLHNSADPRYHTDLASHFVRYLEDHTGFPACDTVEDFDAARARYERPEFEWSKASFEPTLPAAPYVVMELAPGQSLSRVSPEDTLTPTERQTLVTQCAKAMEYLLRFEFIHRDLRTSNIHATGRGDHIRIKVMDLGLMIMAQDLHETNPNTVVKALWNRPTRQYDWVPPEAKSGQYPNFAMPPHSFDAYSFAVLLLRLHGGKEWSQEMLNVDPNDKKWRRKLKEKGLAYLAELLASMLSAVPSQRPSPSSILATCGSASSTATSNSKPAKIDECSIEVPGDSRAKALRATPKSANRGRLMTQGLRSRSPRKGGATECRAEVLRAAPKAANRRRAPAP